MFPSADGRTRFADRTLLYGKWISAGAMALLVVCSCVATTLLMEFSVWILGGVLIFGVPALAWQIGWAWHIARVRRRLESCGYCLCPGCGYDLSAQTVQLPEESDGPRDPIPCPECGRAYRLVRVREAWRESFDK